MENLSGSLNIGDIVYHPVQDIISCGFIIEELKVIDLLPPSGNPKAKRKVFWHYGDITFYQSQLDKFEGTYKLYYCNSVYRTPEECLPKLEEFRLERIYQYETLKKTVVGELEELKRMIREVSIETKDSVRLSNRKLQMLSKFDVRADLERKNLI